MVLKGRKPRPDYPLEPISVADHLRKRRLDLGLTRREAGERLGIGPWTYGRWEGGERTVRVRYYPAIIRFLDYDPLPEPRSLAEAIRYERMRRGLSRVEVARLAGVTEPTIERLEKDNSQALRRSKQAERVDVGAVVHDVAHRLLGRHVGGGAEGGANGGEGGGRGEEGGVISCTLLPPPAAELALERVCAAQGGL